MSGSHCVHHNTTIYCLLRRGILIAASILARPPRLCKQIVLFALGRLEILIEWRFMDDKRSHCACDDSNNIRSNWKKGIGDVVVFHTQHTRRNQMPEIVWDSLLLDRYCAMCVSHTSETSISRAIDFIRSAQLIPLRWSDVRGRSRDNSDWKMENFYSFFHVEIEKTWKSFAQ